MMEEFSVSKEADNNLRGKNSVATCKCIYEYIQELTSNYYVKPLLTSGLANDHI